jgi:hypothetical protein
VYKNGIQPGTCLEAKGGSRLVRAAQAAGLVVERIEVEPTGKISVLTAGNGKQEVAPAPFDAWKDKRNARPA